MNKALRIVLPIGVLSIAAGIAVALVKTKPEAKRRKAEDVAPEVSVQSVSKGQEELTVFAMGTVIPAEQIVLHSEVTGRIVQQSPNLIPGGYFKKGELLARIDPRDYQNELQRQKAELERARFELKVEEGRGRVAQREWKLLRKSSSDTSTEDGRNLALRIPHIQKAQASLAAAESAVRRAEISIARTTLRAPFNAFVREEFVDQSQFVTAQSKLATLVGTDRFWVQASIPVDQLGLISIPAISGDSGSTVSIQQNIGDGAAIERTGNVVQLLGELDPKGRMARVLVAIEDPLGLKTASSERQPPLLLNAYVRLRIKGRDMENVFVIPRLALREGDRVYTVDAASRLRTKSVHIVWRQDETVFVDRGLNEGDRIVLSRIPTPAEGMLLRVAKQAPTKTPRAQIERPARGEAREEATP